MNASTYKAAGVDLELYEQSMQRLPALIRRTHAAQKDRVLDLPGGFAGLFRLRRRKTIRPTRCLSRGPTASARRSKSPSRRGRYDTIGIDLVAMCVNDCLCLGAEPLFFLDYLAMNKDEPDLVERWSKGSATVACRRVRRSSAARPPSCPTCTQPGDFDMAGFCVGVVEKANGSSTARRVRPGDVFLGVPSSGFHSNGYSLIRRIVFEHAGLRR
jgi:phosphoribosylformylglycinamidine cyclo-ligase